MLNERIKCIILFEKENLHFFKNTAKDEKLIHKYEWDNNITDGSVFFEIELLSLEIAGYSSSLTKEDFSRCEQTLASLTKKSIYDNEIILNWLTEENINKYPDYYIYILFLENYRILVIKTCEEEEYEKINKCQSNN